RGWNMTAVCPNDSALDRLLADQLSVDQERELEAHVAGCAACQARLDRLTQGRLTLPTPPSGPAPGHDHPPLSACVLEQMAELLPAQVRLLEQEYAAKRESGAGRSTPPKPPENGMATGPRFTVLDLHAKGGLGRVHRARDEQLRRIVALKEIRPE